MSNDYRLFTAHQKRRRDEHVDFDKAAHEHARKFFERMRKPLV